MPHILAAAARGVPEFRSDAVSLKDSVDHCALMPLHIATDWAVARRRIGKHVPTNPHPTIEGRLLLGNTGKHTS
jgi:hypothetical protein